MRAMELKTVIRMNLAKAGLIAAILLSYSNTSSAQKVVRGTIRGTVIADQGQVVGLRVSAHNLNYKLWYTVFTVKGQYTVPQALARKIRSNGLRARLRFSEISR